MGQSSSLVIATPLLYIEKVPFSKYLSQNEPELGDSTALITVLDITSEATQIAHALYELHTYSARGILPMLSHRYVVFLFGYKVIRSKSICAYSQSQTCSMSFCAIS